MLQWRTLNLVCVRSSIFPFPHLVVDLLFHLALMACAACVYFLYVQVHGIAAHAADIEAGLSEVPSVPADALLVKNYRQFLQFLLITGRYRGSGSIREEDS